MLCLLRMTRNINLRLTAIGRLKRREDLSLIDSAILTRKAHFTVVGPKQMTHAEKLFRARVSFVMVEKIAIATLLQSRTSSDDIQTHAPANQTRKRVDLLHKRRRLHQAQSIRNDELQFFCHL